MAELRTVRVELFGLGGRERSGSFGAVGGGPENLEAPSRSLLVPVGPCRSLKAVPYGSSKRQEYARFRA